MARQDEPSRGDDLDFGPLINRVDALAKGDAAMRAKLEATTSMMVRIVPGCDSVSVGLVLEGVATTAAMSDHVALEVDLLQYKFGQGPCLDAAGFNGAGAPHVVRIDLVDDLGYRRFAPGALDAGVAAVLSLPVAARSHRLIGSLNIYSTTPGGLGPAAEDAAAPFVDYVAEILRDADVLKAAEELVAGVTAAVESSAVINQAIGVLMATKRITAEAALALLGTSATRRGTPLLSAAEAVVAEAAPET